MSLVLLVLLQLATLGLLGTAAAGAGWAVAPRLPGIGPGEAWTVRVALGLGVLGTALFLLGMVGALRQGVLAALALAALALAALAVRQRRRATTAALESRNEVVAEGAGDPAVVAPLRRYWCAIEKRQLPAVGGPGWRRLLPAGALGLVLLPAFVWGLFPPTAFDAVTYHLPFARAFVASGRLVLVPELLFAVFPQIAEVLFAALLALTGADTTTHLVQWLAAGLVAALLYHGGRRLFSPAAGLWAAALWLAHPLVHYQAASAYIDVVLALFCLLALHCWELWRSGAGRAWLVAAGAAAGFAAGTKYLGLIWLALLALATLLAGPTRHRLRGTALLLLVALAAGGGWYARIYHATGNPVHPFLGPLFGGVPHQGFDRRIGLQPEAGVAAVATALGHRGIELLARPQTLPELAWRASFRPETFDRQAPLAPWQLALVPLALAFSLRDRRLLRWLFLVLGYAVAWTTADPRFQLPSMAVLALAGAGALHHLATVRPRLARLAGRPLLAWGLALGLVAPGPLYAAFKIGRLGGLPPASTAAREAYLERQLAGLAGIRLLDRRHGSRYTVFTLGGHYLAYHAHGRLLGQRQGAYKVGRVLPLLGDADALSRELLAMEVTHVLFVAPPARDTAVPGDERFRYLAGDGRYQLYELAERP